MIGGWWMVVPINWDLRYATIGGWWMVDGGGGWLIVKDMRVKDYKDLRVWQQAMDLVVMVYQQMKMMPREELYSLTDQIKRAVVSVPSNIAEGESRGTKEFIHFLRIAQGSLSEIETQLQLSIKLEMLKEIDIKPIFENIVSLKRQIYALMNKLKTNHQPPTTK